MDADLDSNLTYRIRPEGSGEEIFQLFHVDPVTGELSVLKVLDYEALTDPEATYTFTVEAVDAQGIMPPGLASVTVRVMVSSFLLLPDRLDRRIQAPFAFLHRRMSRFH